MNLNSRFDKKNQNLKWKEKNKIWDKEKSKKFMLETLLSPLPFDNKF
jgi:hypothetical protein